MTDRVPVARCSWCFELNPLSANYCKHCGHEAHTLPRECRCRRCMATVDAVLSDTVKAAQDDVALGAVRFLHRGYRRRAA